MKELIIGFAQEDNIVLIRTLQVDETEKNLHLYILGPYNRTVCYEIDTKNSHKYVFPYKCDCDVFVENFKKYIDLHNNDTGLLSQPENDIINHPSHYTQGKFEVIDVIEDWKLPYCLGNTIKYIARAKHKENKLQDLKKARWYLDREISKLEE